MRLAFVTSLIPTQKADTGFEIANRAILDALRASGHAVTCFGFIRKGTLNPELVDSVVIDAIDLENAVASPLLKLQWLVTALRLRLPVACAKLYLAGKGKWADAIKAHEPFDGIILNSIMGAGALPELATLAPVILVEHNVEFESARQSATHSGNAVTRWLYRREARLLEKIERQLCEQARFIWFLAHEDRMALGFGDAGKASVLPLVPGVSTGTSGGAGHAAIATKKFDVGLIGTWTWEPNRIGLSWFVDEVVPLLPADIRIAIAGRMPDGFSVTSPHVTVLGRVADASAFLDECHMTALTSRAGTGVQLKTIETFGRGMPAVATSSSLRGFDDFPANVMRRDDAAAFAQGIMQLVKQTRAGTLETVNGQDFIMKQKHRMDEAVRRGLAALHAA
jgi:hypothetical protein